MQHAIGRIEQSRLTQNTEDHKQGSGTSKKTRRDEINRILRVPKQQGTLYEVRKVRREATQDEILKAFRVVVSKVHPDKTNDKEAKNRW